MGIIVNHDKDPFLNNQYSMESKRVFSVATCVVSLLFAHMELRKKQDSLGCFFGDVLWILPW